MEMPISPGCKIPILWGLIILPFSKKIVAEFEKGLLLHYIGKAHSEAVMGI